MELRFRAGSIALVACVLEALVGTPRVARAQCPPQALFHPSVSLGGYVNGQAVAADVNVDGTLDLVDAPGVAVADFNEDGILDIAATGPALQVHLGARVAGKGVGSFLPAVSYVAGTADVGAPTDSIGVLLGRGDGTFGPAAR